MPAEMQEKTPGVYVRAENELPHELDMLWSGSRAYPREERSPVISFVAGLLVGIVLTSAIFMLFINRPQIQTNRNEITNPIVEEVAPAPETGTTPAAQPARTASPVGKAKTYTVVSGDTLGGIAAKVYGSTAPKYIDKLQRANNMTSPDSLQIGQKLVVPPKDY